MSLQHSEKITLEELRSEILEKVVKVVIPEKYLDENTIVHINPCGRFIIGGPQGDAGLTGRKIIVDTYGGWGAHGKSLEIRHEPELMTFPLNKVAEHSLARILLRLIDLRPTLPAG